MDSEQTNKLREGWMRFRMRFGGISLMEDEEIASWWLSKVSSAYLAGQGSVREVETALKDQLLPMPRVELPPNIDESNYMLETGMRLNEARAYNAGVNQCLNALRKIDELTKRIEPI